MRCWSCGSELEGLSQPLGGLRDIYTCHNCTGLGYLKEIRDKSIKDSGSYGGGGASISFAAVIGLVLLGTTIVTFFLNIRGGFQMLAITIIYSLFTAKIGGKRHWMWGLLGLALYYLLTVLHIFS